jgi:C_GCAxxG_C_C family probable redox protein
MTGRREDNLLKATTGLEGGCVASGSTCGVVTAGALGLALKNEEAIRKSGTAAKSELLSQAGEYVRWFKQKYGASLCRARTRSDFYTILGQLRYFLPGDRVVKCMWHIRGAMRKLYTLQHPGYEKSEELSGKVDDQSIHCAQAVLGGIRKQADIGSKRLENLSFVFDGGVALQGGLCGAVAGAIMGINLQMGLDIRNISYWQTIKAFTIGHLNLLVDNPVGSPESFMAGRQVVEKFKKEFGSVECLAITGKRFSGWDDFQNHIVDSGQCKRLMDVAIREASEVILKYK